MHTAATLRPFPRLRGKVGMGGAFISTHPHHLQSVWCDDPAAAPVAWIGLNNACHRCPGVFARQRENPLA